MDIIKKVFTRAEESVKSNEKLKKLVNNVKSKMGKVKDDEEERGAFVTQINLMIRMVKAYVNGDYRSFSYQTIVMFVFSLVYFITPVDLIPDFIPGLGLTDDLSILYLIIKSFAQDVENFQAWEDTANTKAI